jgi:hypothetical protein
MIENKISFWEAGTKKAAAVMLAGVAFFGATETPVQATEATASHTIAVQISTADKYVPRDTLEQQINTMPDKLDKAFSNLTSISAVKLKPGKNGMEVPVEAKGIIVNNGAKYVFKHIYDKADKTNTGFNIYSIDKYGTDSGILETSALFIEDNQMLIIAITNGKDQFDYINVDSGAYSDTKIAQTAQYTQALLAGVKNGN